MAVSAASVWQVNAECIIKFFQVIEIYPCLRDITEY
jgi:hypothetical protein